MNLAKSALKNKLKKIIHISTSEVYGTALYVPIDEKHDLQPQSPYSASKISAETVMRSFHYSYGLPVVICRLFNTFGPRQSIRAVIPKIISQLLSTKKEIYLGNLKPTRDFNYVLDTCSAIELASKKLKVGQIYNYGSGKEINIKDLFKLISKIIGINATLTTKKNLLRPKKSEVFRLLCDNKKFISATNFKPKFNLKKGLIKTIEWYKNNLDEYKNSEFFE
jgi:nucleoside-diphosphate-sugar epimerase